MFIYRISLSNGREAVEFINQVKNHKGCVRLNNGKGVSANGKSLLGVLWALSWDNMYCQSDENISDDIAPFICKEAIINES